MSECHLEIVGRDARIVAATILCEKGEENTIRLSFDRFGQLLSPQVVRLTFNQAEELAAQLLSYLPSTGKQVLPPNASPTIQLVSPSTLANPAQVRTIRGHQKE